MIVLAAGIPRSGSTWLFNVARLLLASKFSSSYACWVDDVDRDQLAAADAAVVKLHEPNLEFSTLATHILTTHRDLRDIAASLRSLEGAKDPEGMIASAARARTLHEHWAPRADLDIAYSDIAGNPRRQVARVARRIGVPLDFAGSRSIMEAVEALRSPERLEGKHDPTSLLHINHRNDGRPGRWRDDLDEDTARAISAANEAWLRRLGYD